MSEIELELKFVVGQPASSLWDDALRRALEKNDFTVVGTQKCELENTYFDTAKHIFEQHKVGMRVRGRDGQYEQTLKTQKEIKGGLHERNEFNVALADATPDLSAFPAHIWQDLSFAMPQNDELERQFTTHFTRLTIYLKHPLGECELVFDEGSIASDSAKQALNEVEIELVSGSAAVLLQVARLFTDKQVRLSDTSKAAQGYQLLQGLTNKTLPLPSHLMLDDRMSTEAVFCLGCETAMAHWQYHEHRFFAADSAKMLPEIQMSLRLLLQTLSLFLPVLQCQPLLDLQQRVLAFSDKWIWVDELQSTRFLLSKKGPFHKTLGRQGAVVSYLQGRQTGLINSHIPEKLLCSKDANEIKLAVIDMLLTKPWREHAQGVEQPVIEHAKGWLSQGRQTLHQSLQSARPLPAANYIAIETLLRQTLLNGFLLSDLFMHSRAGRAPWLDILIGIDEIRALVLLKQALCDAELDYEEGLIEWVDEKMNHLLQIMERTRQVALSKDVYW
ncbi:CYTH domain-containing protein [Alteromonas sediminis]|uniref:CYTH domain-containing protein n=1 Tax=Alteromonas sediminis TaxID=2259342 RepID=A0A3N5YLK0_9ALTE|nr:CYTH domain-containing protein [Alteromonas sediminis]RPJ66041.1 CYTH domain-containing protein [Alteromonas sediminis]